MYRGGGVMIIKPEAVAAQLKWDVSEATEFCADLLEDSNDHNISAALRAINYGEYDLAIEFIKLNKDQDSAGELTPELDARRTELLEKLEGALEEDPDLNPEDEDGD
jgi:hypothetical protein